MARDETKKNYKLRKVKSGATSLRTENNNIFGKGFLGATCGP